MAKKNKDYRVVGSITTKQGETVSVLFDENNPEETTTYRLCIMQMVKLKKTFTTVELTDGLSQENADGLKDGSITWKDMLKKGTLIPNE